MKKWLVFLLGFISGGVFLLVISLLSASGSSNNRISGLSMFEQPGAVMPSPSYEVLQVVDGGCALANAESEYGSYLGMVVLFLADENTNYYDDQIIRAPKGKCIRQVGTYKYKTRNGYKTVPAVAICNK